MKDKKIISIIVIALALIVITGAVINKNSKNDCVGDNESTASNFSNSVYRSYLNKAVYEQFVDSTIGKESTIGNPNILLNPVQKISNGVAYVGFITEEPTSVSYTVKGKPYIADETKTADFTYDAGEDYRKINIIPIIGMYFDYENEIELRATTKDGKVVENTIKIAVGPAHKEALEQSTVGLTIEEFDSAVIDKLPNGFIMNDTGYLFDFNGDVRGKTYTFSAGGLDTGYLMIPSVPQGHNHFLEPMGLSLYDIMGRKYLEFETGYDEKFHEFYEIHHDYDIDNEGNIYILSGYNKREYYKMGNTPEYVKSVIDMFITQDRYIESMILKYDANGNFLGNWDYAPYFDENKYSVMHAAVPDPVHFNSVEYVPESNSLLLSSRSQNGFMMVDADTGEIKWIFGDVEQYEESTEYLLDYDVENTMIPSGQHTATILRSSEFEEYTKDGKIIVSVHNNNTATDKDDKNLYVDRSEVGYEITSILPPGDDVVQDYSSQLIYAVDVKNNTVEFIREFPFENVHSAATGNTYQISDDIYGSFVGCCSVNKTFIIYDGSDNVLYRVYQGDPNNPAANLYRRVFINQENMYRYINAARYDEDLMSE